jgi:hypothetical protein
MRSTTYPITQGGRLAGRGRWALLAAGLLASIGLWPAAARADKRPEGHYIASETLLGRPVKRGGFHFQLAFGIGGGPDTEGIFHSMEIGGTLRNGMTLGLIHSFIQNRGVFREKNGPDLIGGWMFLFKVPVIVPEVVYKIAAGPGGIHDQSDGIKAYWGPAWLYGFDFHVPVLGGGSGFTVTLVALHAVALKQHHFGVSLGVGWTWF